MSEMTLRCSCCCFPLVLPEGVSALDCPACGLRNVRPAPEEESFGALQRAIELRDGGDFRHAEEGYQQLLLRQPHHHEALWGRLLCHYGVEYVEDPQTHRRMATVHTVQPQPMQEHPDFQTACAHAPAEVSVCYREEAAYIDEAQALIRRLAEDCPDYDVFLCHKTTVPGSRQKTADYAEALKLYHYLKGMGVRVFFAPECLAADVSGAPYEAGIYHALYTAKVMLVLCSEAEYVQSAWVRSEWKRFLALVNMGQQKYLIPLLYGGFDASALPAEFRNRGLQGMAMGQLDSTRVLTERLQKVLGMGTQPAPTPGPVDNIAQLLKRAFLALEDGEWDRADAYAENVLNQDAENAWAYLVKLLARYRLARVEDLQQVNNPALEQDGNYKRALRFGDEDLRSRLAEAAEAVHVWSAEEQARHEWRRIRRKNRIRNIVLVLLYVLFMLMLFRPQAQ